MFTSLNRQRGISLIELMIAMVIGLILTAATFSVYLENRKVARTTDILARMQENARLAVEFISSDARLAGYYGLSSDTARFRGIKGSADALPSIPGDCEPQWYIDLDVALWAINGTNPYLPCIPTADYQAGTDILVVRRASSQVIGANAVPPNRVDGLSAAQKDALVGKVLIRTSPTAGRVFLDPTNPPADFIGEIEDREVITRAYYIRPYMQTPGDGIPTLMYENLQDTGALPAPVAQVLAPGVENFQVQLGIDSNGDGSVNFYRDSEASSTPTVINPQSIRAIRLWLLMRAEEMEAEINDTQTYRLGSVEFQPTDPRFRRLLFTTTITLRNHVAE